MLRQAVYIVITLLNTFETSEVAFDLITEEGLTEASIVLVCSRKGKIERTRPTLI
jgi:hypothetical protein